jgi:subtilase family serine protease
MFPFFNKKTIRLHIIVIDEMVDLKNIAKLKTKLRVKSKLQTLALAIVVAIIIGITKRNIPNPKIK